MELPDYLPISMLNQITYCERRFWLMYVYGEMAINAPVQEGIYRHERAHTPQTRQEANSLVHRRLYIWSDRLCIIGFADVIEDRSGQLIPIEYKRGRQGKWLSDEIQLCAQALCLEERTGKTIPYGEIFYWRSRRRQRVDFTQSLRERTEAAIHRAFQLLRENRLPPPIEHEAKCRDCSLEPICLPRETRILQRTEEK